VLQAAQDPEVASEHDVQHGLLWMACAPTLTEPIRAAAITALEGIVASSLPEVAYQGGIGVIQLRAYDCITHEQMVSIVATSASARRGMATVLAHWLPDATAPHWMQDYAVVLGNDAEADVGDAVMHAFHNDRAGHLMDDTAFLAAIITSHAGQRNLDNLIDACDRRGTLMPVASHVIQIAESSALPHVSQPWRQRRHIEQARGLLLRLAEESLRDSNQPIAQRVLDVLDTWVLADRVTTEDLSLMCATGGI